MLYGRNMNQLNLGLRVISIAGLLLLSACATYIPEPIKNPPAEDLSLGQVQHAPEAHLNKIVRWGGTIISTHNQKNRTELTILAQVLDKYGEPQQGDQSYGRFIAEINGFLDPAIYAAGRAITVYGKLDKVVRKKIDNFEYQYPIVQIEQFYLWDIPQKFDYYDYPYWYDPWYPWYPYYPPYRHRY